MRELRILFRNSLIRNKIIMIYIPLIIIPLLILGWISSYIFTQEIIKKTFINLQDDSSLITTRINSLISNSESCANIIAKDINNTYVKDMNGDVKLLFDIRDKNEAFAIEKRKKILFILNYALVIFPEVESVAFIDMQNELYCTSKNLDNNYETIVGSEIYKKINASTGGNLWFPVQRRTFLVEDSKEVYLSLGKKILDIDRGNMLGALVLNVRETAISSIYEKLGSAKGGKYTILDNAGNTVSAKNKDDLFKAANNELKAAISQFDSGHQQIIKTDKREVLITPAPIEKMGWILVNQTDLNLLTQESKKLSNLSLWIGLICLSIALLGGSILSNFIAKPIVLLTKLMQKVKAGNLDIHIEIKSEDEIGLLASGFNSMLERIRNLLDKVNAEQRKKREFELALMQAQIKPHFLYNTLDLIFIFCSMGRNIEAQNTTKNLADFYRVALSKGKEIITIKEELSNVENYLSIQKVRYSDIFDYEIIADKEVLCLNIPKLTIQPLVENSIYHGLKMKGCFGKLLIECIAQNESAVIKITDDGTGIEKERLKKILQGNREQKQNFGLTSVDERIKLYFGEEYGLMMESEEGKWTTATIRIPKVNEGGIYND